MSDREDQIANEIKQLRAELKEVKELMNMIINMIMEIEPMDDEVFQDRLGSELDYDSMMYN